MSLALIPIRRAHETSFFDSGLHRLIILSMVLLSVVMEFAGFAAFIDPPKPGAAAALVADMVINVMKYIMLGTSSNVGNMLSIAGATCAGLPGPGRAGRRAICERSMPQRLSRLNGCGPAVS